MNKSALRLAVIERDKVCVAAQVDLSHSCRDQWGNPHRDFETWKLTLDHVRDSRGRRQDLPEWCIATCSQANVQEHWVSANRDLATAYLCGVRAVTT